jgi:BolA protein
MTIHERLSGKLSKSFSPEFLDIVDESYKHRGHPGFKPGGETHFRITMVSAQFSGKNRVERQRMVYEVLREELQGQIHALCLFLQTPEEQASTKSSLTSPIAV